jgi:hypothetical protein
VTSWIVVKSSDPRARALRDRHYSTARPGGRTVGPPGRRLVLVTADGLALWVTHWPRADLVLDGIDALRCTVFRNEGPELSSALIREAMGISEGIFGRAPAGWITYVWPARIASSLPRLLLPASRLSTRSLMAQRGPANPTAARVTRRAALPEPRWQTPLPETVVGSWGPDVERFAGAELGIVFDRWQRRAINRALAFDAAGRLVHRHYLVSAGRQNGKTGGVRSLVGWALTSPAMPAWELIMGIAHDRTQARVPYTAVLTDLERIRRRSPRLLKLTRYLGIRSDLWGRHREYHVASREARDALRTFSVDLAVFDEIRTQRNYDTWAALEPTTRARPEPLVFAISSAGDDASILLRDWWDRGRRIIAGTEPADGFGMTWYAADDELAPDDPVAIRQANPAVAEGRIPIGPRRRVDSLAHGPDVPRGDAKPMVRGHRRMATAGHVAAGDRPYSRDAAIGRVVLGVETVPTWRRATVSVAIETDVGVWIGVAGELDSSGGETSSVDPRDLGELVERLAADWKPDAIAYSVAAAAAPYAKAAAERARVPAIELGPRQIRAASTLFRSELIAGRLAHEDDALLAQQVRAGRPSNPRLEAGEWYFSIPSSVGEIDALRSAAWAAWAAIAPEARKVGSQIHV